MASRPRAVLSAVPPPEDADPAAIQAFIAEHAGKRAAPAVSTAAPEIGAREGIQRLDGRDLRRKTVYLPRALAKRLAVHAKQVERSESDIATEAFEAWLKVAGA